MRKLEFAVMSSKRSMLWSVNSTYLVIISVWQTESKQTDGQNYAIACTALSISVAI